MTDCSVRRVNFGYFVRPAPETGTGIARMEACLGYLAEHHGGAIHFGTGSGRRAGVDAHYRPRRRGLDEGLADVGVGRDGVRVVRDSRLRGEAAAGWRAPVRPVRCDPSRFRCCGADRAMVR
jgi:N-acyl homoserine lactone hydrolase